jgi:hypothetical protein
LFNNIDSLSQGKNNSSSLFAIETSCSLFKFSKNSLLFLCNFFSDSMIFITLDNCHFHPSIIIKSGITHVFSISFKRLAIISAREAKSSILLFSKVFILNFL